MEHRNNHCRGLQCVFACQRYTCFAISLMFFAGVVLPVNMRLCFGQPCSAFRCGAFSFVAFALTDLSSARLTTCALNTVRKQAFYNGSAGSVSADSVSAVFSAASINFIISSRCFGYQSEHPPNLSKATCFTVQNFLNSGGAALSPLIRLMTLVPLKSSNCHNVPSHILGLR